MDDRDPAMKSAAEIGLEFIAGLPERRVGPTADADVAPALGRSCPTRSRRRRVIRDLAAAVDPGLMASAGPRFFGFVVGGALPASAAADWLATAWGQNAALHAPSPAAAAAEQVAGRWMLELLGLPADASFGLDRRRPRERRPRGGPSCGPRARRMGRRGRWAVRRAGDHRPHRRRGACHGPDGPPVPRPRAGAGGPRPGRRSGPDGRATRRAPSSGKSMGR